MGAVAFFDVGEGRGFWGGVGSGDGNAAAAIGSATDILIRILKG
jgi:hypothetical protein